MFQMLHEREIRNVERAEALKEGRAEGRLEMFNSAIEFMRSKGISDDEISDFRNTFSKP